MNDTLQINTETERRQIFFNILTPYLIRKGYKPYLEYDAPSYVLQVDNIVYSFFFNFYSDKSIGAFPISITHYDVEDYMLKYELPCYSTMEHFRKKVNNHLLTTHQRSLPSELEARPLYTKKNIIEFANNYIKYLENEGKAFIETYSYLPNILDKMDELRTEGKNWDEILRGGGPIFFMEGLIISKLCNDPDFDNKFQWLNNYLLENLNDEWKKVWLEFIPDLKKIQPIYKKN